MILTVTANPTIDRVYFVDGFEIGNVYRVGGASCSAGGKGINVARVAHIMGCETAAMGFVGGYAGAFIKDEVEKQGIKNLFTDIKGETRTNVNISDKSGKSGELLEYGPEITIEEREEFIKDFSANVDKFNIICVSGSLPRGLTSDFYKELVCIAKEKGKKIIVDTSGNTLKEVLSAKPYMVKPNSDEVAALMHMEIKTDEEIKNALLYLYEEGVEVPFISLGGEGAAAMTRDGFYKFLPPEVTVINAVGSGDCAVAGLASGLDMGYDIIDSLRLAMAAGAANTQFEQTGIVTRELVDKFVDEVLVKKM